MLSENTTQILAFDLSYNNILKYHLPAAYIVNQKDGVLQYVSKAANEKTIEASQITLNKTAQQLLNISHKLSLKNIYKKYNVKNKTAKPLELLIQDDKTKQTINYYINFLLESFFKLISKTKIPLAVNLDKTNGFKMQHVFFSDIVLEPKLHFSKTDDHIIYRLSLTDQEKEYIPHNHEFKILLDNPPWVVNNHVIYGLKYINANKLKPFLNKREVIIPNKNSVAYFNTFIKKVIKNAPIEAEGFKVITNTVCKGCIIKPATSISTKVYLLELHFIYDGYTFSITEHKTEHIRLSHNDLGDFSVYKTIRSTEEEHNIITKLKAIGFHFLNNKLATFHLDLTQIDRYYNLSKLITLQKKIKAQSITIDLKLNNQLINVRPPSVIPNFTEKNDWFDVEIHIEIGAYKLPFSAFITHLKSGERLYQLPDDSVFIIPIEWYSRYKSLIHFGNVKNNTIKIQKNQFTVLEEAGVSTENTFKKSIISYEATGHIKATLRGYQNDGVNWLVKNYQLRLGSCLADDMGLGKTLQTLTYLDFVYTHFEADFTVSEPTANTTLDLFSSITPNTTKKLKALIVSPSSLTYNWFNEAQKFAPHFKCLSYVGKDRSVKQKELDNVDLVFTSYGVLLRDVNLLETKAFNFLIIDESQQIKNRNSKIYKAINSINTKHKVSLSGTPIENSLSDLWSQMQFINPNVLNTYASFDSYFKKPIEKYNTIEKINALKSLINPYLLRRTKTEVVKDLPEVSEQIFYTELAQTQAKLYEQEKSNIRNYIIDKKTGVTDQKQGLKLSILNALSKLRQLANHPILIGEDMASGKFKDVTAYLETLIRAKQKTLIFSSYTSHLKIYTDWCNANNITYNLLTGSTKIKDREKEVTNFQNNANTLLFFISLKAGGTGLNLTKASYVIILDPWWNPFAELQAIGRAHRIGQQQKVNVVRFISKHTIEEKINQLQLAKKDLSDNVIEDQMADNIFENLNSILELV